MCALNGCEPRDPAWGGRELTAVDVLLCPCRIVPTSSLGSDIP